MNIENSTYYIESKTLYESIDATPNSRDCLKYGR